MTSNKASAGLDKLKAIRAEMKTNDEKGISNDVLREAWNEETKFLMRAIDAINDSKWLADRFGSDLSGALQLAPVLRAAHVQYAVDSRLTYYAVRDDDFKDEVWHRGSKTHEKPPIVPAHEKISPDDLLIDLESLFKSTSQYILSK